MRPRRARMRSCTIPRGRALARSIPSSQFRFIDLFAGIGGFSLGLGRAGMRAVAQVEIADDCRRVLGRHWPWVKRFADVREFSGVPFHGRIDLVCGGFPCQDISTAGNGLGLEGERSGLWREMHRIIRESRPRWVLAENVPALRIRGADRVIPDLEELRYTVWPFVVGANAVRAPHHRERAWIVAFREGAAFGEAADADLQRCHALAHAQQAAEADVGKFRAAVSPDQGPTPWSAWASVFASGRLDSEPTLYRVDDGLPQGLDAMKHRVHAMGNAVVPQVVETIGRVILQVDAIAMGGIGHYSPKPARAAARPGGRRRPPRARKARYSRAMRDCSKRG